MIIGIVVSCWRGMGFFASAIRTADFPVHHAQSAAERRAVTFRLASAPDDGLDAWVIGAARQVLIGDLAVCR